MRSVTLEHFPRDLYPQVLGELDRSERASWLNEEMAVLTDPATYELHPSTLSGRRIKVAEASGCAYCCCLARARGAGSLDEAGSCPCAALLKDGGALCYLRETRRSSGTLHNWLLLAPCVSEAVSRRSAEMSPCSCCELGVLDPSRWLTSLPCCSR